MNALWQDAWDRAQPTLSDIHHALRRTPRPEPRILRVGQLDSELLDVELGQLLQQPVSNALGLINSTWKTRFTPELNLIIQTILYKLSVWDTGASYGARLQGLKYVLAGRGYSASGLPRHILLTHGGLTVLLPYLHTLIRGHALSLAWPDAPSSDRRRKAWDIFTRLESVHTLAALSNFVLFLWNGRYRTLADRVLRLQLVPAQRLMRRDVSYEFMNRQMVWHAFTEFLLFLLPLINTRALRRRVGRILSTTTSTMFSLLPRPALRDNAFSDKSTRTKGKFWAFPEDQCAICAENASFTFNLSDAADAITAASRASNPAVDAGADDDGGAPPFPIYTPYATSCGHTYCYTCLAERMMRAMDENYDERHAWSCLRCSSTVRWITRYEVPVEQVPESSDSFDERDLDSVDDYEFSSMSDVDSGSIGTYDTQSELYDSE